MNDIANRSLRSFGRAYDFETILADPPWRFQNRTGKMAPEHRRLARYETMTLAEIKALPVKERASESAHLYLWVPNALLAEGLAVMACWGFSYKTNLVWYKTRKDGGPTVVALASTSVTSPSWCSLAFADRAGRFLPVGGR